MHVRVRVRVARIKLVARSTITLQNSLVYCATVQVHTCAGVHDVRAFDELGRVHEQHEPGHGGREVAKK